MTEKTRHLAGRRTSISSPSLVLLCCPPLSNVRRVGVGIKLKSTLVAKRCAAVISSLGVAASDCRSIVVVVVGVLREALGIALSHAVVLQLEEGLRRQTTHASASISRLDDVRSRPP